MCHESNLANASLIENGNGWMADRWGAEGEVWSGEWEKKGADGEGWSAGGVEGRGMWEVGG